MLSCEVVRCSRLECILLSISVFHLFYELPRSADDTVNKKVLGHSDYITSTEGRG